MCPGYRPFDERFAYLFNSYYEGEGERHRAAEARDAQPARRSTRCATGARMSTRRSSARCPACRPTALELVELGINHEQQHQELFLTDILATFAENPLEPAYGELPPPACHRGRAAELPSRPRRASSRSARADDGFAFDCERPRHRRLLHPHAHRQPAGHQRRMGASSSPTAAMRRRRCGCPTAGTGCSAKASPRRSTGAAMAAQFTLAGRREIDRAAPVAHVSFYEADAFARWAGARLPTEAEWEDFAASADPKLGNQLDRAGAGRCREPAAASSATSGNGPQAPSRPTPASRPPRARSANITASS